MTRSTLYRRLKVQGTNFKQLRDEVIINMAKEVLSGAEASITEIALQLGYSELSAFRHLTGEKPRQYRQRQIKSPNK